MKKLFLSVIVGIILSCSSLRQSQDFTKEDNLFQTRKYVGNYIDYRHTGYESFAGISLIWIKTSLDSIYGKISAYGKKCEFSAGERLFIRRTYYSPGEISSYWVYTIENEADIFYRVTEFQYDHKVYVDSWFR
jgi:hypothetical protein